MQNGSTRFSLKVQLGQTSCVLNLTQIATDRWKISKKHSQMEKQHSGSHPETDYTHYTKLESDLSEKMLAKCHVPCSPTSS